MNFVYIMFKREEEGSFLYDAQIINDNNNVLNFV